MSLLDRIALWKASNIRKPVMRAISSMPLLRVLYAVTIRSENFVPLGISQATDPLGGIPALRLGKGPGAILCLHGGGFATGSSTTHAPMAGQLAKAAGRPVWVPDYRLAPEHAFPAALDDCETAYRALLDRVPANQIALTGDSAGGALCLSLLHVCARKNLPLPGVMALMSPLADLRPDARHDLLTGPDDALLSKRWGLAAIAGYLDGRNGDDPLISPLAAPFSAAPPSLIHYAQGEALTPQIQAAAAALQASGAQVQLQAFDPAYHSFQIDGTPIARRSITQTAEFMNSHLP